ncbi:MAG TPA: DNA polymerase IV [Candidatus Thermoplasmatota archaeon]|nr:DNA polymerase IV [Candidatus Thermoplasmatota archaeon]
MQEGTPQPQHPVLFHVDMDAFYASVEVRDDPRLKGLPLVIGADPQGGRGRGVVCTASYEARAYGIRSAMPISQAWRAAPHATYLRPDFRKYGAESRKVMDLLEGYAAPDAQGRPLLQVVGMDEAYLDVTARCTGPDGATDWALARSVAQSLQAAVRRATGLSCSVGIGPSKSVAKIASDHRKPHGTTLVRPGDVEGFLAPLGVGKLNGCGPKTAALLREMGLPTIGHLAATPLSVLEARLGSHGAWLHRVARGDDPRQVTADEWERKSRGNETTFPRDQADPAKVLAVAAGLMQEILEDQVERDGRPFSTVTVKLRYDDFTTLTRSHSASAPLDAAEPDHAAQALRAVHALLAPLLDGRPVRLVGVRIHNFAAATGQRLLNAFGLSVAGIAEPELHGLRLPRVHAAGGLDPGGLRWTSIAAFG